MEAPSDENAPEIHNVTTSRRAILVKFFKENSLLIVTLISVFLGFVLGFVIRSTHPSNDAIMWIGMPGEIFLRSLKAIIIPLIISNMIAGSSAMDVKSNSKLGMLAFVVILASNLIGSVTGLIFFMIIKPGAAFNISEDNQQRQKAVIFTEDLFADLIRNIFPDNILAAAFRQTITTYKAIASENSSEEFGNNTIYKKNIEFIDNSNILGLITVAFVFGVAASSLKEQGEPFRRFFQSTSLITTEVIKYLLKITPIGIASLIMASIAQIKDINVVFTSLGMFTLTVFVGLLWHIFVVINLIYYCFFRKNPLKFLFTCIQPYILAFTFTSSSAAFPEMESTLVEKNNSDKKIIGVSLPLIVTLNAGGSALFIVTAAMFLASFQGVYINAGDIIVLVTLTTIVVMALPGIPSSSIVTLILLLTSMNISSKPVAMLYALEWLLDRLRTGNNVLSHILGCLIVDKISKCMSPDKTSYTTGEDYEEMTTITSIPPATPEDNAFLEEKTYSFTNGINQNKSNGHD
ncbi:neutral amino acid transporter A-like [Argonauta hians]